MRQSIRQIALVGSVILLLNSQLVSASPFYQVHTEAYFRFDTPPYPETFIIRLTDAGKIAEARAILDGSEPARHIMGQIVKQSAVYNPPWSYHLDPNSIQFFDSAIEVCDAAISYVELHLDEACGAFLPGCTWCPWRSRLIEEVQPGDITWRSYFPLISR